MLILSLRTDKPEAELTLLKGNEVVDELKWHAHKELSINLLAKIDQLLKANSYRPSDIEGLAYFSGPGSFTGLRIGAAAISAMAYTLSVPLISRSEDDWQDKAVKALLAGQNEAGVSIKYGAQANITKPKK